MNVEKFTEVLDGIEKGLEKFKTTHTANVASLQDRIEVMEAKRGGPSAGGGATSPEGKARKKFGEWARKNDQTLLDSIESKDFSIAGGAGTGSGTVPLIIANEILTVGFDENPLIGEVLRTASDTGDYRRITNRLGSTSGWAGETDTRNATSTSTLREIDFVGGEVYAYPKATSWIMNDSKFDLANLIITDAGREFGNRLVNAILFGNGSNKPIGILNTSPTTQTDVGDVRNADAIRYLEGSASPNVLDGDLLIAALMDLLPAYRRNAIWVMNSLTLAFVRKLKDNQGRYLWQPSLGVGIDTTDGTLLGKRVVLSEQMQTVGTGAGNFSILVGDFKRCYELVSVGGMLITRDDNLTSPGYVKWYIRQRYLGRMIDNNAVRAIRD